MTEPMTSTENTTPELLLTTLIEKFAQSQACWYSSIRKGNRVHLAPIWHVWHEHSIYVVTQPTTVRAQNLQFNNSVSLSLPDPMNVLIIEGTAEFAEGAANTIQPLFQTKYNWDIISDTAYHTVIRVVPGKLLAWGDHGSGRWRYNSETTQWTAL